MKKINFLVILASLIAFNCFAGQCPSVDSVIDSSDPNNLKWQTKAPAGWKILESTGDPKTKDVGFIVDAGNEHYGLIVCTYWGFGTATLNLSIALPARTRFLDGEWDPRSIPPSYCPNITRSGCEKNCQKYITSCTWTND